MYVLAKSHFPFLQNRGSYICCQNGAINVTEDRYGATLQLNCLHNIDFICACFHLFDDYGMVIKL